MQLPLKLLQFLQKLLQKLFAASARTICAEVVCNFCWSYLQLLLEPLMVFLAKFHFLENYMFSPFIILVSNRLVG